MHSGPNGNRLPMVHGTSHLGLLLQKICLVALTTVFGRQGSYQPDVTMAVRRVLLVRFEKSWFCLLHLFLPGVALQRAKSSFSSETSWCICGDLMCISSRKRVVVPSLFRQSSSFSSSLGGKTSSHKPGIIRGPGGNI